MEDLVKNNTNLVNQELLDAFAKQLSDEFYEIAKLGEAAVREKIKSVQDYIQDLIDKGLAQEVDFETVHRFAPNIYLREVHIPKDQLVVGKIHRYEHLNFISKGSVTVLTKDGAEHYVAPVTMTSSAGTQRLLYTHEDTVWSVIHPNKDNERDLAKIEETHIAKNYDEFPILEEKIIGE